MGREFKKKREEKEKKERNKHKLWRNKEWKKKKSIIASGHQIESWPRSELNFTFMTKVSEKGWDN